MRQRLGPSRIEDRHARANAFTVTGNRGKSSPSYRWHDHITKGRKMGDRLYQCMSERDQTAWTVSRLKAGGAISDVSLWLAGVDRPMRLVARVKSALRAEDLVITSAMKTVSDAAGEVHDILTWQLQR